MFYQRIMQKTKFASKLQMLV